MLQLRLPVRLRWPWQRGEEIARDVDEEIAFHLEARTEELVRGGLDSAAARAQAEREFGDIEAARNALRSSDELTQRRRRMVEWLNDARRDLRLAFRTLARDPGFAGSAIVVLAFGIGLSVAMFSVANTVLRRPLPIADEERVVSLWAEADGAARKLPLRHALFERFREEARLLSDVAGTSHYGAWPYAMREGSQTLSLNVAPVTGNLFELLGTRPVVGRMLRSEDDVVGAAPVAVISHSLWRRRYGGDPGVVGHRLTLHGRDRAYMVVGVAPPGLEYPIGTDLWVPVVPFTTYPDAEGPAALIEPVGRLAGEATAGQAAAELEAFIVGAGEHFGSWRPEQLAGAAVRLPELVVGDVRSALLVLSGAAALLLLIACINVANLLLVRATRRGEEIGIRRALGAARGRIVRQLLTESSVLAVVGGLLGAALASGLVRGLVTLAPTDLPRLEEIRLSGVPLGLAAGITIIAVVVFGLIPALWTSGDMAPALRSGVRSATEPRARRLAQRALVVFQMGLGIVVLASGALLGRSLLQLNRLDMGFTPDRLVILQLAWPWERYDSVDAVRGLYDVLIPRLEALPDIGSATPVVVSPFAGEGGWDGVFVAEGQTEAESHTNPMFNMEIVGPGYLQTLGVSLLRGRGFTDADHDGSPRVAMVSDAVARRIWPGQDALGKRIALGQPTEPEDWWTVVGVVPETRYRRLREPAPTVYLPHRQRSAVTTYLAVRTNGEPPAALSSIRHALLDGDLDVVVMEAQTMDRLVANQLAQPRLSSMLLGAFGVGAVVLAAIGLYAVLAFVVRQRRRELAIRHALGASPAHLRALVLRQALLMAGAGVVLGLGAALAGGRFLQSLLFGVSPADPLTLAGVSVGLLTVALAAAYLPAGRATRADAVTVLRQE